MSGPWEKYQTAPVAEVPAAGPWLKYQSPPAEIIPTAPPVVEPQPTETELPPLQSPERWLSGGAAMRARGLSSPDPAEANAKAAAAIQSAQDEAYVQNNPVGARLNAFNQGLPFIGEYYDEALGAIGGEDVQNRVRAGQAAFSRARPMQDVGLKLAGGVVGSIPMAVAAAPAVAGGTGATMATNVLRAGGAAGLAGALEGGISGYGRGNDGDRVASAQSGALLGGALGAGIGVAAPLVGAGIRNGLMRFRGSDVKAIASQLGVSDDAARAIKAAVDAEDMTAATANIARGGPDAMLVEGGPALQALGKGVKASGGQATRIMTDAVTDRATGAAGQMRGVLDNALGVPSGRADLAARIRNATAAVRDKAFKNAYATPIDYSSPAGRNIESLLARLPPKKTQAAIAQANDLMRWDKMPSQIMATVGPDGKVAFSEMPNAIQLHYIKTAFDDIARDGTDAVTGKMTGDAAFAARVAKEVRNAHGAANPAYREALRTGLDNIQGQQAAEAGYKALLPSTSREMFFNQLKGLNQAQRDAAKLGMRQYIDDQTANVRAIMSRPNTDIGEAMKGLGEISSPAARQKLSTLLGKTEADKLIGEADRLRTAFEIQAALSRNSDTAVNQAVQGSVDQSVAPGALRTLMQGRPLDASKRLVQIFTGSTPEAQEAAKAGIYTEIAKALTGIKGKNAEIALQAVNRAMRGQVMNETEARRIANIMTSVLAGSGYQTGTQLLERP